MRGAQELVRAGAMGTMALGALIARIELLLT